MDLCFTVLEGGSTLLTALSATQGVRITSMCTTPRARNPGLHRPRCLIHSGLEFFLAAQVPVNSNTVPRRHGRIPTNQMTPRTEGVAQTCRAILHCRTDHRSLKSTTEKLGDTELSTSGRASVFKVQHCGIQFLHDLCVARPHEALPPLGHPLKNFHRIMFAPCRHHVVLRPIRVLQPPGPELPKDLPAPP